VTGPIAVISHSLVTGGCEVDGTIENSVLFHSVTVEEGANVHYSILMPGAVVKAGAQVNYSIVAENAVIEAGAVVGSVPSEDPNWGIAVVASGITVGEKAVVSPNAMIRENVKGGERA
jgi:glucose-1-phosphate adenylyltransferase